MCSLLSPYPFLKLWVTQLSLCRQILWSVCCLVGIPSLLPSIKTCKSLFPCKWDRNLGITNWKFLSWSHWRATDNKEGSVTSSGNWRIRYTPGSYGSWGLQALCHCPWWHGAVCHVLSEHIGWLRHVGEGGRLTRLLPGPAVSFSWWFWGKMLAHPFNGIRCPWARR